MIRTIEVVDGATIQKVTYVSKDVTVTRYQAVPAGALGDTSRIARVETLAEARNLLGIKHQPDARVTLPKSAHAQNQKGYRADNQRAKAK